MLTIRKYGKGLLAAFLLTIAAVTMAAETININTADASALDQGLIGVGTAKAKAIVAYREKNGAFKSIEELANVPGIGEKIIEANRAGIRLTDEPVAPSTATTAETAETPPETPAAEVPAEKPAETTPAEAAPMTAPPAAPEEEKPN